jgi:hypothetical protein
LNALFGSQKNVKGKKLREEKLLKVCLVQRIEGKGRNFNKGRGEEYFNSLCVWFKREERIEEILIKYTFGSQVERGISKLIYFFFILVI